MKERGTKEKKEVGFFTIINTVSAVFIVLMGLIVLLMGIYAVGALFIALSAFLFLPQKFLKIAKWMKFIIALVLFFTLVIYMGLQLPQFNPPTVEHRMGEEFTFVSQKVNFTVLITNTSEETILSFNGQERTTEGVFLIINGFITNKGNVPASLSFEDGITDANNKAYAHSGYDFGGGPLQPEVKKSFYYVFELPKNIAGPKFWIKDDTTVHNVMLISMAE